MMYPVVGLIGRNGRPEIEVSRLRHRLQHREVAQGLVFGDDAISLLCAYLMRGQELAEYVAARAPEHR